MPARRLSIAIDVALFLLAAGMAWGAARMPSGTVSMPGPGLVPLTLAAMLAITSLVHMISSIRAGSEPAASAREERAEGSTRRITIMLAAIAASGLLLERIGYLPTAALFLFVLLWSLSDMGWWRSALAAMAGAWVSLLFFRDVLAVALPGATFPWPF
jgi:putative tricarboxylic transport membrane protein